MREDWNSIEVGGNIAKILGVTRDLGITVRDKIAEAFVKAQRFSSYSQDHAESRIRSMIGEESVNMSDKADAELNSRIMQ